MISKYDVGFGGILLYCVQHKSPDTNCMILLKNAYKVQKHLQLTYAVRNQISPFRGGDGVGGVAGRETRVGISGVMGMCVSCSRGWLHGRMEKVEVLGLRGGE